MSEIYVDLEFTPNPDSLKYLVNRSILTRGTLFFPDAASAKSQSGLAESLFEIQDVKAVMLGTGFVTVTLANQDNIHERNDQITECIKEYLKLGKPVVEASALPKEEDLSSRPEVERKIIEFLDKEVRPAVAMDGGDISFESFHDGTVYLKMQGSCAGCPSSLMTLREGVESRLKQVVPEVQEVVPV